MQTLNRDKVTEVSKLNARVKELETEWNRAKKEKEEASKLLVAQQDINSKNLTTIKELKEIITKKEEMVKEAQKELKSL
jgi:outer membrane murein-binding lipoprotein Lpp